MVRRFRWWWRVWRHVCVEERFLSDAEQTRKGDYR